MGNYRFQFQNGGIVDTQTGQFFSGGGNSGGGNFNGGNNNNFRGNNNNNGGQRKKHSGAKMVSITKGENKGKQGISAWNYSRRGGLISLLLTPYGKTDKHKSKTTGRIWQNWMVKVTYKSTKQPDYITSALYDEQRGFAIIKEFGWKVNPKAPNGGYCGTFNKKN